MESSALRALKVGPLSLKIAVLCQFVCDTLSSTEHCCCWSLFLFLILILARMEEQNDGRNVARVFEMGMEFYTGWSSQK